MKIYYPRNLPKDETQRLKEVVRKTLAQWGLAFREVEGGRLGELEIYQPEYVVHLSYDRQSVVREALGLLSEIVSMG